MRRAFKIATVTLGSVLGGLIVLAGLGWLALQTTPVRARIAAEIARAASGPGQLLALDDLGGTLPFDLTLAAARIADDKGVWGVVEQARVTLSPWALMRGRIVIERLEAARVAVDRLPEIDQTAPPAPGPVLPPRIVIPRIPVAVSLDHVAIARIDLGAPLLGSPAVLSLAADARAFGRDIAANVDLKRIDDEPGSLRLKLAFDGSRLDLDTRLDDPGGRLIERLSPAGPRQPVILTLAGSGPLGAWRGRLELAAGTLVTAQADLTLGEGPDYRLTLDGSLRQDGLLPPDIAGLVHDGVTIGAVAMWRQDGVLVLDRLALATTLATLDASGSFDQEKQAISANAALRLPDIAPLSGLAGTPLAGRLDLDAEVGGTVARPELDLRLSGSRLVADTLGIDQLGARVGATRAGDTAWRVQGRGDLAAVTVDKAPLPAGFGQKLDWTLAAVADPAGETLAVDRFTLASAGLNAEAGGTLGPADSRLKLTAALADVAALRPLVGMAGLRGRVELAADIGFDAGRVLTATVDARAEQLATGIAALDPLLGRQVTVAAAATRDPAGHIALSRLDVAGGHVTVAGDGTLNPADGALAAKLRVALPRLAVLGQALHQPLAGRAELTADLGGTLEKPTGQARLTADGTYDGLATRADIAAGLAGLDTLRVTRIAVTAAGAELTGALDIGLRTQRASGKLAGRVPDLAPLSPLAGMPLAGQLGLDVTLGARDGQTAELTLTGNRIAAAGATIGRVAVTAQGRTLDTRPAGQARVEVQDIAAGPVRLGRTTLNATARQGTEIAFDAATRGSVRADVPLDLTVGGRVMLEAGGQRTEIATLRGKLGPEAIGLRRTLRLALLRDATRVDDLALNFGSGRIDGQALLEKAAAAVQLKIANLPLPLLASLGGATVTAGTADLDLQLSGPPAAPRGRIALDGRKLRMPGAGDEVSPPLDVSAVLVPGGDRAEVEARLVAKNRTLLALTGTLPLRLGLQPLAIDLPQTAPIALKVDGEGDLRRINDFLPLGEDRLSGPYRVALTANGTLAEPQAAGSIRISGGRYLNQRFGTEVADINLELAGNGTALRLTRLDARDAGSGRITAEGNVDLLHKPAPALNFTARLQQFQLAASDDMRATANADLRLGGTIAAPSVYARIQIPRAQFLIPDRLPPSVVNIEVEEIDSRKPAIDQIRYERPKKTPPVVATLDVVLDVPGQTFVRGRGLDSEWRGRFVVGGTSAAPNMSGSIEAVQGTLQLLGKGFTLRRGEITFPSGLSADAYLDILAEHRAVDIVAQVLLQGSPLAPRLTLTSQPELPQDQVMSRVLFGKSPGSITAAQGVQLAYAVRTLTSGGPGLMDRLRESTGLDRLDLGGGDPSTGPTVSGGKYIADGVFVGIEQGASANSTRATVEVEVLPTLTARSAVGGSSSLVGVDWQYDY